MNSMARSNGESGSQSQSGYKPKNKGHESSPSIKRMWATIMSKPERLDRVERVPEEELKQKVKTETKLSVQLDDDWLPASGQTRQHPMQSKSPRAFDVKSLRRVDEDADDDESLIRPKAKKVKTGKAVEATEVQIVEAKRVAAQSPAARPVPGVEIKAAPTVAMEWFAFIVSEDAENFLNGEGSGERVGRIRTYLGDWCSDEPLARELGKIIDNLGRLYNAVSTVPEGMELFRAPAEEAVKAAARLSGGLYRFGPSPAPPLMSDESVTARGRYGTFMDWMQVVEEQQQQARAEGLGEMEMRHICNMLPQAQDDGDQFFNNDGDFSDVEGPLRQSGKDLIKIFRETVDVECSEIRAMFRDMVERHHQAVQAFLALDEPELALYQQERLQSFVSLCKGIHSDGYPAAVSGVVKKFQQAYCNLSCIGDIVRKVGTEALTPEDWVSVWNPLHLRLLEKLSMEPSGKFANLPTASLYTDAVVRVVGDADLWQLVQQQKVANQDQQARSQ